MHKGKPSAANRLNQLRASHGSIEEAENFSPNSKKFQSRGVDIFQDSHDPNQYDLEFSKQRQNEEVKQY